MTGAFGYLIGRSTRNKLASQLRRVRNPRYAIGLLLGLAYFGLISWNSFHSRAQPVNEMSNLFFDTLHSLFAIGLMALSAYLWLEGSDRSALSFTQAEVMFLFPAPVSRRSLILYKLARAQTGVVFTSLLWLLISRRSIDRGVAYWIILSVMSLHRLGIALVRAAQGEHGRAGVRRHWASWTVFGAAIAIVVTGLARGQANIRAASGAEETVTAVLAAFHTAPVSWVLYPFEAVLAPAFAHSHAEWLASIPVALLILILHFVWVIRSDAAFEESAAEASATQATRIAAIRSRGIASATKISARNLRRTLPLKPTGPPALALVWKNYLWLLRTGQVRSNLIVPICIGVIAAMLRHTTAGVIAIIVLCLAIAFAYFLFGPMTLRNDLRAALGQVSIVKTYPMAGKDIMFAEIGSSASAMAAMQLLLVFAAIVASSFLADHRPALGLRIGLAIGAPLLVLGLNFANFCIHNGIALMFPAWVRVGENSVSGLENTGQMMLLMIITVVMLALFAVLPAIGGAVIYSMYTGLSVVAVGGGGVIAGALLVGECWLVTRALGGLLDRLEPMHVR